METVKVKSNRFGTYYIATRTLWVRGKPYKVKQERTEPNKEKSEWKLTRTQMISILKHTKPEDWLFRSKGHFDGMVDGWVYDNEGYKEATPELINWIIRQLKEFDYMIIFMAKDTDIFGNKVEPNTFEIFDIAIHSFVLKPKDGVIKFSSFLG